MASLQKKLWVAIETIFTIWLGLILVNSVTKVLFNTKMLNLLIDEIIEVLVIINRNLVYISVIYCIIDIGLLALTIFIQLLKTIGLNRIYNALKLTTYVLSVINVLMFIGWYIHLKNIVNDCTYYFNHYYLYQQQQDSWINKYFQTYDVSKYYRCENNKNIWIWSAFMLFFVISLYVLLGAIKIVKLIV
jgi:hypothetical protein